MELYRTSVDIANRALQHCGVPRLDATTGFSDGSRQAAEVTLVYDKLRQAELRRNEWRFAIRYAVLRPVDRNTRVIVAAAWSNATTYQLGSIVKDSNSILWISVVFTNLNKTPGTDPEWEMYFGPLTVTQWTSGTTYYVGELVYKTPGDGTYTLYRSLENSNEDNPATAAAWDATVQYAKDELVDYGGTTYKSSVDFNLNYDPSSNASKWTATVGTRGSGSNKWQLLTGTLERATALPASVSGANVFILPAHFLKLAVQAPKVSEPYRDWQLERKFLMTTDSLIVLRFVADMADVTLMDPMFIEGLACRIGYEVCEPLTQSASKRQVIAGEYAKFMGEARLTNAIETGPVESPEDEFITCRA